MGMPSYQASAVKAYLAKNPKTGKDSYATNGRGSPDVSLLGEQFEVYTSGPFGGLEKLAVGGTSASTPSWGAIISLLNEECLSASGGKKTLGFVNPLFYQNADAFTDITKGSNAIARNAQSGWKCTEGWDAVTGLGTPQFTKLQNVVRKACGSTAPTTWAERNLVDDEGNEVEALHDVTASQCEIECEKNSACHSFSYSSTKKRCHLKDRCVAAGDRHRFNGDYVTYYKPCSSAKDTTMAPMDSIEGSGVDSRQVEVHQAYYQVVRAETVAARYRCDVRNDCFCCM